MVIVADPERFPWRASASVPHPEAASIFDALAGHLGEHLELSRTADAIHALTPEGELLLSLSSPAIDVSIKAIDTVTVARAMELVTSHMQEFSSTSLPQITWRGNAATARAGRCFRMLTLTGVTDLSPNIRRLTFRGAELQPFADGLHVQLFLPCAPDARLPEPDSIADGKPHWDDLRAAPFARTYTIRRLDPDAGTLDIDFVLHHRGGVYAEAPGASFAALAAVGMRVGMLGPGGRSLPKAQRYVLAGDETALPMIARLMETLPTDTHVDCLIEIENADDRQSLATSANCRMRWLERDRADSEPSALLLREVLALNLGPEDPQRFILFAARSDAARQLRLHLREELQHSARSYLSAGFW